METNAQIRATAFKFEAPINAVAFAREGDGIAFGLGNGLVHIAKNGQRLDVPAHNGAVPCLKAYGADQFASLSDDGTLKIISDDGNITPLGEFKGAWTERMDVHPNGSIAVAAGNQVHLWTKADGAPRVLGPHTGTVNDVCFTQDGMGLACAHRDGMTLWAWPHFEPTPTPMAWKGGHLAITLSENKRWVVTAMQEGALHLWNLPLKRDYQMGGYSAKPTALAWSANQKWLGTSGAESVIIWPFDKAGPEGREPLQLGWSNGAPVSALASHPKDNVFAAGFADGAVMLIDIEGKRAFNAAAPSGHAISAIAFSADGARLLVASQNGGAALFFFS